MLGLALVVASRGLAQRIDAAWYVAFFASLAALVFAFLKAIAIYEAALLAFLMLALFINRAAFERPATLMSGRLGPSWLTAMAIIILAAFVLLLFIYRDTQYTQELWWQFEFSGDAPRGLRALLGVTIGASVMALFSLLRPAARRPDAPGEGDIDKAVAIVMASDNADANLVRMGDKRLLFSRSGRSFLMYGIQGRSWIALADPVGDDEEFPELVWSFIETAREGGGRAAFYQISSALLAPCVDAGLRAFKLGELASVDLAAFELKGGRLAGIRQSYNRGLRDGLTFELVETAADLSRIIDTHRREWNVSHVLLVGYSFGADALPATFNRLPEDMKADVSQITLMALTHEADFEISVEGWLGGSGSDPIGDPLTDIAKIDPARIQCIYGKDEDGDACPELTAKGVEVIGIEGGHHFDGDYNTLIDKIFTALMKRLTSRKT